MSSPPIICAFPFDVRPGEVDVNLRQVLTAIERAQGAGAGLLALPEKWPTSFLPSYSEAMVADSERALQQVHEAAERVGITVIGSAPCATPESSKPLNQIHFLGAGGDHRPFSKRILFSPTGEGRQVAPGSGFPQTLETPVGRVCALVCYEIRFPELTREAFYQDADLIVVPAQWPYPRTKVFELLSYARAAENQSWLLSCNRSGQASLDGSKSRVLEFPGTALAVDPLGNVAVRVDDGEFLTCKMDLDFQREVRKKVPCARDLRLAGLWPEKHSS